MKYIFSISLIIATLLCLGVTAFAEDEAVMPMGEQQHPVYTDGYNNKIIIQTALGGWWRSYNVGVLISRSRVATKVVGSEDYPISNQEVHTMAKIENRNTGEVKTKASSVFDSNRQCIVKTDFISSKYATGTYHSARLKVNGEKAWPLGYNTYTRN